jgi:diguanylate cyclase (GGDEF)-like protein/PAS domain S-box-containing protein
MSLEAGSGVGVGAGAGAGASAASAGPAPQAKVVVIDDNATNRSLMVTLMKYQGHQVFEAHDGREGLELARSVQPQLVISDIVMPTMDGYEFVRQLRADPELADIEVIFYTAHFHEREAQKLADACDVARVLTKPCEPVEILDAVQQVMSRRTSSLRRPLGEEAFDREHLSLITNKLAEKADELQVANGRLTALTELNLQLASERDLHLLLDKVCYGARQLLGARYAVLAVIEKYEAGKLFCATSGIEHADDLPHPPLPKDDPGPLGRVFALRTTWRVDEPPAGRVWPPGYPAAQAYLAVPIGSLMYGYGWLCLGDKIGATGFAEEDERLLEILAAQAGRIYENGSLHREVQMHAAQLQIEIDEREIANAALRQVEERFRQLAENIQDVFFIISAQTGETIYLSPAYERVWGRRADVGEPLDWTRSIHPEDRRRALDQLLQGVESAQDEVEYRIVLPDGSIRWIQARFFPVRDALGKAYRVVGIATDVTERRLADEKIRHLNRVYSVLSGINSLIVRASTPENLFSEACRLAVSHGGFALAWIGSVDPAAAEITPVACSGRVAYIADAVVARTAFRFGADTLIAAAVVSAQPQICDDLAAADADLLFGAHMQEGGCRSVVVLPLVNEGATVACLLLATDQRGAFDEAEMRLLSELADDISFALDHIDKAARLNYLAYYDSLTGFANRSLFLERLAQHISVAFHGDTQFLVVIADLERFDTINDTYGRKKGDVLLKEISERFSLCIGDANAVARVGPDLFAAIIPFAGEAEVIIAAFEHKYEAWLGAPFSIDGNELRISARSGIALFPHDATDADALLKSAEAALKRAKTSGDKFVFFTREISEKVAERLSLETQLRRAIANQEFVLHYQPKVDLETRAIEGVEALMRWQHPDLGLVSPVKFIGIMEETGMIVEAGAWALHRAAKDRAAWLERGINAPRIAVNVSSVQVRKADFVSMLINAIGPRATAGQPLHLGAVGIDIEVTESLLLERAQANIEKLKEIRGLGIGIAIDDFGTGYSSLSYLAKLPVAALKIDRSFTAAMLDDPGVMTLVSTMITLAHSLKLKVIAEGVELEEQAKILRLLRCDQMQGYLVSRPVPFEAMTRLLEAAARPPGSGGG